MSGHHAARRELSARCMHLFWYNFTARSKLHEEFNHSGIYTRLPIWFDCQVRNHDWMSIHVLTPVWKHSWYCAVTATRWWMHSTRWGVPLGWISNRGRMYHSQSLLFRKSLWTIIIRPSLLNSFTECITKLHLCPAIVRERSPQNHCWTTRLCCARVAGHSDCWLGTILLIFFTFCTMLQVQVSYE